MNQDLTRIVAFVLIHFLWQGTVLAILLQPVLAFCRSAKARYNWSLVFLALMALAPVATLMILSVPEPRALIAHYDLPATPLTTMAQDIAAPATTNIAWMKWLVIAWGAGVVTMGLRVIGGWVALHRLMQRESQPVADALMCRCHMLQNRLALSQTIRFVQSSLVRVPAVIGWLRPVVLLPVSAITGLSPSQLDAIILHELAHIRRLDAFVNLFQILVETVLFYHPAVWWVSGRIRDERENCCDDIAVGIAGDSFGYAMALTLLEADRALPAAAMAATGGVLKQRVMRLIGHRERTVGMSPLTVVGAVLVCMTIAVTASHALVVEPEIPAPPVPVAVSLPAYPLPPAEPAMPAELPPPAPVAVPALPALPAIPPVAAKRETDRSATSPSYIGTLTAAGLKDLSVDQLIALKTQGVSAEYVVAMRQTGITPTVDQLFELRNHGVKPADVAEYRALGMKDLTVEQLVMLRDHGVSSSYAAGIRQAGYTPTAEQLVSMRDYGVRSDDAAAIHALGLKQIAIPDLIQLRMHGVSPDFIHGLKDAGLGSLTTSDFIKARDLGITPSFVAGLRDHGMTGLSLDKMVALKNAGVY